VPGLLKFGDRDTLGRGRYWKVVLPSWGCGGHHWKFHLGNLRQLGCCPLVRRLVLHDFRKATESLPSRKCVKNRSTLLGDVSIWLSLLLVTSLEGVQPSVRATIRDHNSSTVQAYEDALRWRSGYSPLRHPLVRVLVYVAFGAYSPPPRPPRKICLSTKSVNSGAWLVSDRLVRSWRSRRLILRRSCIVRPSSIAACRRKRCSAYKEWSCRRSGWARGGTRRTVLSS